MVARVLAGLVGLLMGLQAVNWLLDPTAAAASLGMNLLDGMGRSTQVGDFTAFFVCCSGFALWAAWKRSASFAAASAALLFGAAVFRTFAWIAHGAELATNFIVIEIVLGGMLVFAAIRLRTT